MISAIVSLSAVEADLDELNNCFTFNGVIKIEAAYL